MNNYQIEIPNGRSSSYKIVTVLVLVLNILVSGYLLYLDAQNAKRALLFFALLINIAALILFLRSALVLKFGYVVEIILLITSLNWLLNARILLGIVMFLFAIMGFYTNRKQLIIFTEEGISYPSFPIKNFDWKELSSAMLKDEVLTIDLKNNQLLQFRLDPQISNKIDENEFNLFCRSMMNSSVE